MTDNKKFGIAFVGCGYVADFYFASLTNHEQLVLKGVYDENAERKVAFATYHRVKFYEGMPDLLADKSVDIVFNLTNPRRHYEVSHIALRHGKHVYTEKPLGWKVEEGNELSRLAKEKGLKIAAAPCSILGEAAQTAWKLVREGAMGKVRLVYAELDDGFLLNTDFMNWKMPAGAPWPYKDEFETGCTLEHSAYAVSWLVAMFGNVKEVIAFAAELIPEKVQQYNLGRQAPDFSVGILIFESGVVARLTNSILAPRNHSMSIIGDQGTLTVDNAWDYGSRICFTDVSGDDHDISLCRPFTAAHIHAGSRMDFSRGIAELANAIDEDVPCRLSPDFAMHVDEICHAIASADRMHPTRAIHSRCNPIKPMDWAS